MRLEHVKVGDEIFVYDIANGRRTGPDGMMMTVVKVTKQTVYVEKGWDKKAFDKTGRQKQDSHTHFRAWVTRAAFDAEVKRADAWSNLRVALSGFGPAPDHLTTERIEAILKEIEGGAE